MFAEMQERLQEAATEMLAATSDQMVEIVPQIILALVVLLAGAIVAGIARKAVLHIADFIGLDKLAAKVNIDRALKTIGLRGGFSKVVGFLVYWFIVLFALLLMSEVLELGTISDAISAIVAYIPKLIAGLLILVIGLLVGRFFRDVISTSLARAGIAASEMLGYIVQGVIIIFVCLLALKQVGFDVSVITTNIAVILGVLLVSTGLGIAIAIRPVLENYFICRQLKRHIKCGDQITFENVYGTVASFSLTSIAIRYEDTEVIIPARHLFERQFSKKIKT